MDALTLQNKIDEFVGLKSELLIAPSSQDALLRYSSPNGTLLFTIKIFKHLGVWKCGGRSKVLPDIPSLSSISKQ